MKSLYTIDRNDFSIHRLEGTWEDDSYHGSSWYRFHTKKGVFCERDCFDSLEGAVEAIKECISLKIKNNQEKIKEYLEENEYYIKVLKELQ